MFIISKGILTKLGNLDFLKILLSFYKAYKDFFHLGRMC